MNSYPFKENIPADIRATTEIVSREVGAIHGIDAIAEALLSERERCAKIADEAREMRERLFNENGASLNASKAAQAEEIASAIRG